MAGEAVTITGVNNSSFDGTFYIASVTSTTFTYIDSAHSNLGTSGSGTATASFFDQGAVQTTASAINNPSDFAPIVAQGPLVPATGWSFVPAQGTGTIKIVANSSKQAYDITTSDATNGGATPSGDVLAYVFLHVISGTSPVSNISVSVVDSASSLLEDTASYNKTGNSKYTLGTDQDATVAVVADGTAPATQLSINTNALGAVKAGNTYTVPVVLTPGTPGGPGVSSANADILFDPDYINPNSITVTAGNLITASDWQVGFAVDTSGSYGQDGTAPSYDTAAITLSAVINDSNSFSTLASNSTGSLWVITFTTQSQVPGLLTALNLVPDAEPAIPTPTTVRDNVGSYTQYTFSPASTWADTDTVDGPITFNSQVGGTKTSVTSSNRSISYGTPVTFTATVTANSGSTAPTAGSVDFYDTTAGHDLGSAVAPSGSTGTTSTWTLATGVKTFNVNSRGCRHGHLYAHVRHGLRRQQRHDDRDGHRPGDHRDRDGLR